MPNKTVYLSKEQEGRLLVLGVSMATVIETGLKSLEGVAPLQALSPDLRESVIKVMHLLDVLERGRLSVLADHKTAGQNSPS